MPEAKTAAELPDVQNDVNTFAPKRINKVGINKVLLPCKVEKKDRTFNDCIADISVYSDLNKYTKGVNMSRFRIILEEVFVSKSINLRSAIRDALKQVKERLEARDAYLKVNFDYFLTRYAPVTKIPSLQNYRCTLEGRLIDSVERYYMTVKVPYTSLCPCSKKISKYNAHNQRSTGIVTVELIDGEVCWIEDIIDLVEATGAAPIINILKRPDEKWQTEQMFENPVFVEDMARKMAVLLDELLDKKIKDYVFIAEHHESIHMHDAISVISAGREMK